MGSVASTNNNYAQKKSNVKLQAQHVSPFDGVAIKWRSWKKRTRAAIGTAGMLEILDSSNSARKNLIDNETVFHLLQVATADGSAAHLVDAHESTKDGNAAYVSLVNWYEGDDLTTETAEDVRSKLDKLNLNTKTSASEYINMFQLLTKQLEELGESYTQSKTVQIFLSQISDPDFDNTKELCVENRHKISECIERIRAKERRLSRGQDTTRHRNLSIRRNDAVRRNFTGNIDEYINAKGYYSIPRETWYTLDPESQERVKKHNGALRKSRRGNTDVPRPNQGANRFVTARQTSLSDDVEDQNPSPRKKLRTVQFTDGHVSSTSPEHEDDSQVKAISQRRGEVLSFRVNQRDTE